MYAMDGACDSGDGFFTACSPNSDCLDCDPCQLKRYDGCDACVAAGCYWCPFDSLCLSGNPLATGGFGNSSNPFQKQFLCNSAEDFTQTCPLSNSESYLFDDPLYDAESWVYDLIGVQQVWKSGISKFLERSTLLGCPTMPLTTFVKICFFRLCFQLHRSWCRCWYSNQ
jgi:hypothetical protein